MKAGQRQKSKALFALLASGPIGRRRIGPEFKVKGQGRGLDLLSPDFAMIDLEKSFLIATDEIICVDQVIKVVVSIPPRLIVGFSLWI